MSTRKKTAAAAGEVMPAPQRTLVDELSALLTRKPELEPIVKRLARICGAHEVERAIVKLKIGGD